MKQNLSVSWFAYGQLANLSWGQDRSNTAAPDLEPLCFCLFGLLF